MKLKIQDATVYHGMSFNKGTIKNMLIWEQFNTDTSRNKLLIYSR